MSDAPVTIAGVVGTAALFLTVTGMNAAMRAMVGRRVAEESAARLHALAVAERNTRQPAHAPTAPDAVPCAHADAVPVDLLLPGDDGTREVVGWLCPACDTQLDTDPRPTAPQE